MGLVASDIGRASRPCSVNNCRKVNWVGRNMNAFGFSSSIAWVLDVSGREETTESMKPPEGPTDRGPPRRRQDTSTGFPDAFRPGSSPAGGPQPGPVPLLV